MQVGKKSVSRSQQSIIFVTFGKSLNLSEIQFTFYKRQVDQMAIKIFSCSIQFMTAWSWLVTLSNLERYLWPVPDGKDCFSLRNSRNYLENNEGSSRTICDFVKPLRRGDNHSLNMLTNWLQVICQKFLYLQG